MYDVHTIVSEAIDTKKNPKLKEVFSNAGVGIDNDRQELWNWDAGISIDPGVFPG